MTITASDFDAPFEALFDRTAYLKRFVPDVQVFTADDTWTKPADAVLVDFVLVGGGAPGGDTGITADHGAGGGANGVISRCPMLKASDVPATLYVFVGEGGTPSASGDDTVVNSDNDDTTAGAFWLSAARGLSGTDGGSGASGVGGANGWTTLEFEIYATDQSYAGGAGGADSLSGPGWPGSGGGEGAISNTASDAFNFSGGFPNPLLGAIGASGSGDPSVGGAGATVAGGGGDGGKAGLGFGAGGGGAGGHGVTGSTRGGGGGGGAPGYGSSALAADGDDGTDFGSLVAADGGSGAAGVVIITTWRAP